MRVVKGDQMAEGSWDGGTTPVFFLVSLSPMSVSTVQVGVGGFILYSLVPFLFFTLLPCLFLGVDARRPHSMGIRYLLNYYYY